MYQCTYIRKIVIKWGKIRILEGGKIRILGGGKIKFLGGGKMVLEGGKFKNFFGATRRRKTALRAGDFAPLPRKNPGYAPGTYLMGRKHASRKFEESK